jgi:uncharacterized protein (TIGR02147 family)
LLFLYILIIVFLMALSVFDHSSYKDFLKELIHSKGSERGIQSKLARHIGCQASYLYQVLKEKAELTEDQAFKTTTFLNFNSSERNYFLSLVRMSKASSIELRDFLLQEIQLLKIAELSLKNQADAETAQSNDQAWDYYFSSDLPSLIHVLTSSEKFQTLDAIAKKIGISNSVALLHLNRLSEFGFVSAKNKKWQYSTPSIHLPKESKHNLIMQLMRRSQIVSSVLNASEDSSHFCSLFTLDKASYKTLRQNISDFIKKSQKLIHLGGTDEAYVLAIDLCEAIRSE